MQDVDAFGTLAEVYRAHDSGEWSGQSPEDLVREWANCSHAELHPDGSVYIEDPQDGHYIHEDRAAQFVAWMVSQGVTGLILGHKFTSRGAR